MTRKRLAQLHISAVALALILVFANATRAQEVKAEHARARLTVPPAVKVRSRLPQNPTSGSLSFLPAVTYAPGGLGYNVAVGDINGDGKLDLVTPGAVLFGNGDGTFLPPLTFDSGGQNGPLVVTDLNGDGKPDVVIASECYDSTCRDGSVGVLLGRGNGNFDRARVYRLHTLGAEFVAVADLNDDGKLDLVIATCGLDQRFGGCNDSPASATVLLGNGDGTYQTAVTYNSGGYHSTSVAVADFNADGIPDLVLTSRCAAACEFDGEGDVSVLLGKGDGTFAAPVSYDPAGQDSFSVAAADVNGDGKPDLLVANDTSVSVLLGNGDGSFQTATAYDSARGFSLVVADLNGDGHQDLAVADAEGMVDLLLGNGDGTFQPTVKYSSGGFLDESLAAADINADGQPDIVVGNRCGNPYCSPLIVGTIGVLFNDTASTGTSTDTLVISSLNPSFVGQGVTFTAVVSSTAGFPPDGESVIFNNGLVVLGRGKLNSGIAALTTNILTAGSYNITATYLGDAKFGPSVSPGLQQVANSTTKSPTSTTLVSGLNPSTYGQNVTFTATVTSNGGPVPTGRVSFVWGGNHKIGAATLSNGVATLTIAHLNADSYPLTAEYSGDASNLSSISPIVNQVVNQATSAATLTSSPNPSTVGQAVTFTVHVTSPTVTPQGPVTFTAGNTVLGTASLNGSGHASLTVSSLPAGMTTVTAAFAGNSNIAPSSASVTQTVQ